MEQFFQQLTNGLAVGGIYALIALGYTMVYGVLKLINFAHGDLFTLGAYLALTLLTSMALHEHLGPFLGVLLLAHGNGPCGCDRNHFRSYCLPALERISETFRSGIGSWSIYLSSEHGDAYLRG